MIRLIASASLLIIAAACSPSNTESVDVPAPPAETQADDLSVKQEATVMPVVAYQDAFIMEPIGGRDMTMGGVTLAVANADAKLVAASSPSIGTIELHTMAMVDGKMTMRQVEGFDINAGEELELKRGGNHFMMFDIGEDVVAGETIDITLDFKADDGQTMSIVVPAEVRAVGE